MEAGRVSGRCAHAAAGHLFWRIDAAARGSPRAAPSAGPHAVAGRERDTRLGSSSRARSSVPSDSTARCTAFGRAVEPRPPSRPARCGAQRGRVLGAARDHDLLGCRGAAGGRRCAATKAFARKRAVEKKGRFSTIASKWQAFPAAKKKKNISRGRFATEVYVPSALVQRADLGRHEVGLAFDAGLSRVDACAFARACAEAVARSQRALGGACFVKLRDAATG